MNTNTKDFLEIIGKLLDVPSPGKYEFAMADTIAAYAAKGGHKAQRTPEGNLTVSFEGKNPNGPLTIMAAHMDEIAMVITGIYPNGDLKVCRVGGLQTYKLGERMLEILTITGEKIKCLFSIGSEHGGFNGKTTNLAQYSPQWKDVRVITGLTPKQLEAKGVRVGLGITPIRDGRGPYVFGDEKDPLVAAWTFDDRAGIALLIQILMRLKAGEFIPENPLMIAFTVQEEGGCYGAKILAARERPEIFIAVDGCPIVDASCHVVDERPGCWIKDGITVYDPLLLEDFKKAAKSAGTEVQVMSYAMAGSDASSVYAAGFVPRIGFIGHVRENSHGFEVAKLKVFDNALKLIETYIRENC